MLNVKVLATKLIENDIKIDELLIHVAVQRELNATEEFIKQDPDYNNGEPFTPQQFAYQVGDVSELDVEYREIKRIIIKSYKKELEEANKFFED